MIADPDRCQSIHARPEDRGYLALVTRADGARHTLFVPTLALLRQLIDSLEPVEELDAVTAALLDARTETLH